MTVAPPRPMRLRSTSSTRAPLRAAASAAYMPAPPAPMIKTSVSIGVRPQLCVGLHPVERVDPGLLAQLGQILAAGRRGIGNADGIGDAHEAMEGGDDGRGVDQPRLAQR